MKAKTFWRCAKSSTGRFLLAAAVLAVPVAPWAEAGENQPGAKPLRKAPAPLYRDPVHDGAADPALVWNRAEKCWWMLYTSRRADADNEKGVKWVHGTDIGLASTRDYGTWPVARAAFTATTASPVRP